MYNFGLKASQSTVEGTFEHEAERFFGLLLWYVGHWLQSKICMIDVQPVSETQASLSLSLCTIYVATVLTPLP